MSGYFDGPKPAGKVALPPALNPGGDHRFDPPPVQVRAHTRAAPTPKPKTTAAALRAGTPPPVTYQGDGKWKIPPQGHGITWGNLDAAAGLAVGIKPSTVAKVFEHPLRFAAKNRKAFESSGYKSAPLTPTGLIQAVGLSQVGRRADETSALTRASSIFGGRSKAGKDAKVGAEAIDAAKGAAAVPAAPVDAASALRGALSGKTAKDALKTMGEHEAIGAKLDNPNLGKSARELRKMQEAGYSVERSSRAAKIHAIYNDTSLSVAEREYAADTALRGELPKVYFDGFKDLTPETLDAMKAKVMEHPTLLSYGKKTVIRALNDARAGEVPTNSELNLIETVFGKDTRDSLAKYAKETSKWKDAFYEVGNIPRSLMSSVDVSGVLRQGIGAVINHPIISGRNLPGMIRAANHEAFFQQGMTNLAERANAPKYDIGKLAVTNLEDIGKREESFASNLAEKLTGLGNRDRSPVRWSGRAYTYFLATTRADIYDHYDMQFARAGVDVHSEKFIKGLSTMINSITGRGFSLGGLSHGTSGKALNTVLFSPNLMASRFDLLNPIYYAKMPKELRLLALRHSLATVGAIASTLELARLAGFHVGLDPRSADFAKIKVGNTRIDIAAGYQQTVRMLYQVAVGQTKSSSTGQVVNLRSGKYGEKSVTDVLTGFFENKESPLASITSDFVLRGGKNTIGQKMTPGKLAGNYLTPMLLQDLTDIYNEKHGGLNGIAWAIGAAPLGAAGVGLQTYETPKPKAAGKPVSYFGSSSSGVGSPYFATPKSGGGGGYFGR